jgi:hypothetical protein
MSPNYAEKRKKQHVPKIGWCKGIHAIERPDIIKINFYNFWARG